MFCPECKGEFREGFVVCNKCNVDLVNELPVEEVDAGTDSVEKTNGLSFLNWEVEHWLKLGGITLIVVSFIVESLQTIVKLIPGINSNIDGQIIFYSLLGLIYSLIKNTMYGVFYIALGKLIEVLRGKKDAAV